MSAELEREAQELRLRVCDLERQVGRLEEAEDQILGARAQAQALLDNIPHMAWMKSADGVFLAVNESFARAAGHSKCEILGKTDRDIWPAELAERYANDDRRVMASGEQFLVEEPIAEQSGTRWFETFKTPIRDTRGCVTGTVGLARDTTERRQAEEHRQYSRERMQQMQKLESLGVLAGGIAHDFNNLLMGVLANAEWAIEALSRPEPRGVSRRLEQIRDAALSAAELTNQMLAYSGRGHFVVRPVSVNAVVDDISHLLSASITKKARLQYDLATNLPPVLGDVAQMQQVVMNLITNASDALGERRGRIRVRTGIECVDGTVADLHGPAPLDPGIYVFLEVSDDGCGMDSETRSRLFEPFYTTKATGRGLGLSAVQGIVRGHRGGIVLNSVPGAGTTIRVLIPRTEQGVVSTRLPEPQRVPRLAGDALVLVVDDDTRVRDVTGLLLRSIGLQVVSACGGREAIDTFQEKADEISLVLLDVTMPDLNGDQVLVELRRTRPDLPVILSSGYTEHEMKHRFCFGDSTRFLQKPYRFEALRGRVHELLGRRQALATEAN